MSIAVVCAVGLIPLSNHLLLCQRYAVLYITLSVLWVNDPSRPPGGSALGGRNEFRTKNSIVLEVPLSG